VTAQADSLGIRGTRATRAEHESIWSRQPQVEGAAAQNLWCAFQFLLPCATLLAPLPAEDTLLTIVYSCSAQHPSYEVPDNSLDIASSNYCKFKMRTAACYWGIATAVVAVIQPWSCCTAFQATSRFAQSSTTSTSADSAAASSSRRRISLAAPQMVATDIMGDLSKSKKSREVGFLFGLFLSRVYTSKCCYTHDLTHLFLFPTLHLVDFQTLALCVSPFPFEFFLA
jgi:hypothetical protein